MHLKTGSKLQNGKYEIIRSLGQGGFGITYEAEQVTLHRHVAIKEFFMKDYCEREESTSHVTLGTSSGSKELVEKFRTKFIREAQMIAGQDHPHIVKIYDVFEENGTAYYVMEFLEGGSLADLVKQEGPLPESRALDYIRQVGDALSHLHSQNCLHFDVKPSNILLNRAGKAVLIDFGISKHYDEAGSQTSSTPVGISKGYAPLEQYQQAEISSFTPATDIYALGATLFFLLTGQTPPSASEVNEDGLSAFPSSISKTIQDAIVKAMSPRRKSRPQTVIDFVGLFNSEESIEEKEQTVIVDTKAVKSEVPVVPQLINPPSSLQPLKNSDSKSMIWLWVLIVGILVGGAIVWLLSSDNGGTKENVISKDKETAKVEQVYYKGFLSNSKRKIEIEANLTFQRSINGVRDVKGTYHYSNKPKDAILHVYGKLDEYNSGRGKLVLFCRESPERFDLECSGFNNISGKWRSYTNQSEVEAGGTNFKSLYNVQLTENKQ